jgi:hypothetical protein
MRFNPATLHSDNKTTMHKQTIINWFVMAGLAMVYIIVIGTLVGGLAGLVR